MGIRNADQPIRLIIWPEYQECLDCPQHRKVETTEDDHLDYAICVNDPGAKCPSQATFDQYFARIKRGLIERN